MTYEDHIQENLNSLGNLDRSYFKYLSENSELFYESYSEKELEYIKYLFKLLSYEFFPNSYRTTGIKLKRIEDKIQFINAFNQRCYEDNGQLYITPLLEEVDAVKFKHTSINIRNSYEKEDSWKQKIYSENNYKTCNNYIFDESCSASIYNNEIITLLNNSDYVNLKDLIASIIELGGKKIESYDDKYNNYINLGFMPISVCKWDDRLAPKKWLILNNMIDKNGNIKQELINNTNYKLKYRRFDIIFYIYTGQKISIPYTTWLQKVGYSENYTEAKNKLNKVYKDLMEVN